VAHNLAVDALLRDRRHRAISDAIASALATLENNERDLIERTGWRMLIGLLASFRPNSAHVWNYGREACSTPKSQPL
jgi:hypothetical protein